MVASENKMETVKIMKSLTDLPANPAQSMKFLYDANQSTDIHTYSRVPSFFGSIRQLSHKLLAVVFTVSLAGALIQQSFHTLSIFTAIYTGCCSVFTDVRGHPAKVVHFSAGLFTEAEH